MDAIESGESAVRLESWGEHDLPLLQALLGDPAMMAHLGGPESPEKIAERQARYEADERLADSGKSRMFKIVYTTTREGIGWVGYWQRRWLDAPVYEMGWSVLPSFQGRGIAGMATAQAIRVARARGALRFLHAFPSANNLPSNAICRKLGFTLLGVCELEYPPGQLMLCNDWQLDLCVYGARRR